MGTLENKMETTIIYWGDLGTMEKKMEATLFGYPIFWGHIIIGTQKGTIILTTNHMGKDRPGIP